MLKVSIYRYNPEADAGTEDSKPRMQTYDVDLSLVKGSMLLDVLMFIKNTKDSSLTFRRSCGEGVCGSDGMNINGKNGLACITPIARLPKEIVIRPLPGMPIIRDLIVDMSNFYQQYKKVKPYLDSSDNSLTTENIQFPEERAKLDGLYECVLCACCSSSCPSYWWNPDKFVGPAGLLQAARFIEDSRDEKKRERLDDLKDAYSVFRCRSVMNCADVCPKGLNPNKAIGGIISSMIKEDI